MPSNKFKTKFPPARIKKIMQTDEEVGKVAAAVPVIVSKSLELFTEIFLQKSGEIATARGARTLSIDHIKECVDAEQKFDFLREIVAEAAAKAVGKSLDDGVPSTSHPPAASRSNSMQNGTKETSNSEPVRLPRLKKRMLPEDVKCEPVAGTSSTTLPSTSNFSPKRNHASIASSSVITKLDKGSCSVKREVKPHVKKESRVDSDDEEDFSDDSSDEELERRRKPASKKAFQHPVIVNSGTSSSSVFPSVKDRKNKLPQPVLSTPEVKKSTMSPSVIVKRDPMHRSQSHTEVQPSSKHGHTPESNPVKSVPSSAPPFTPTPMQFMYGTGSSLYSPSVLAETFPYTPPDMTMMQQHQQGIREPIPRSMPAYSSPRDYYSDTASRSVITPTAEAQDLRVNRQQNVGSNGQHVHAYRNHDGPF